MNLMSSKFLCGRVGGGGNFLSFSIAIRGKQLIEGDDLKIHVV